MEEVGQERLCEEIAGIADGKIVFASLCGGLVVGQEGGQAIEEWHHSSPPTPSSSPNPFWRSARAEWLEWREGWL